MKKKPPRGNSTADMAVYEGSPESIPQVKNLLRASLRHQDNRTAADTLDTALDVMETPGAGDKAVEQALVAEHLFRKAIEDAIPAGIAGYDMEGRQIYLNQAFRDMFGFDNDTLLGCRPPFPYWPQRGAAETEKAFREVLSGSRTSDAIEMCFQRKTGDIFWGLVSSSILSDSEGNKIGLLISVVDITKQKRVEQTLRTLSSRLINAQENERKLVSQDLHDSIGGKLAGIKYSLEKVLSDMGGVSSAEEDMIKHTIDIVTRTIEESQRISKNLHPSLLDDLGLISAVRAFCREFQEVYTGIAIDLALQVTEDALPDPLKIILYRILQEALNNVAKHSDASKVSVKLIMDTASIKLTIHDNGKGFDVNENTEKDALERGLGIESMAERAEFSGGRLQIESGIGKGSMIHAVWPCRQI